MYRYNFEITAYFGSEAQSMPLIPTHQSHMNVSKQTEKNTTDKSEIYVRPGDSDKHNQQQQTSMHEHTGAERQSMTLEVVNRHEKLGPKTWRQIQMTSISGAAFCRSAVSEVLERIQ